MHKVEYTCVKGFCDTSKCSECLGHFDPLNEPVCKKALSSDFIRCRYYTGFMSKFGNWLLKIFNRHVVCCIPEYRSEKE